MAIRILRSCHMVRGSESRKKQCLMTPAMTTVFENITC